jgi:peptide/nickel transport system ATP-binding protein
MNVNNLTTSLQPPLLELDNLQKWYPVNQGLLSSLLNRETEYVKAVDGVSLQLQKGEILGLVGESGSGKSTLGELVVLLQQPTKGNIHFEGTDISSLRGNALKQFRRRVQVIFQDPYATLDPRFQIYRTVVEPLLVNGIHDKKVCEERVQLALKRAGLRPDNELLSAYPHQLSGGQRQRVAIARAIVLEPALVVADEPVSMLDVSIRSGILNLLAELRKNMGLAIIFISHDLSTVQYLCDRIAIMYLGQFVEIGPTERVIGQAFHSYARALLNAVPVVDPDIRRERSEIDSEPPSSIKLPPGCRFSPRCPFTTPECIQSDPVLNEITPNHWVRCIHPRFEPLWS